MAELIAAYSPPMPGAGDEPGDVQEDDPAGPGTRVSRGQAAADQVHPEGDHEQLAPAQPVRQPAEEQCAEDLADQVDRARCGDRGRGQVQRAGLVSTRLTALARVISRPSRIHATPSATTILVWNRDHGSRSSRAGIRLRAIGTAVSG